jgi:YidC/Oxa1 family membrane protein insertase
MIDAINSFFGKLLSAFNGFTGSYLLALFIFALLVKLILLPFGIKQQKNSIKQAHVKPREMAIRNKYKGRTDQPTQQKMQSEIMEVYQQEGYSPMSGCLPLLIQLPLIMILYNVVTNPLRYICNYSQDVINKIAEFLSTVTNKIVYTAGKNFSYDINLVRYIDSNFDGINGALKEAGLSEIVKTDLPNFSFFGLGERSLLAETPSIGALTNFVSIGMALLILVPVLNFALTMFSTWVQKKLTFQPMQDQAQGSMKFMNLFMAGMTTWIAFSVPAAIGIYWLFNNILGMAQQFILAKVMPLPKFTEEDYKKAEREYLGKSATRRETVVKTRAALSRPMDDDEYADLGDYVSVYDERPEIEEEPSGQSAIEKAPLKKKK